MSKGSQLTTWLLLCSILPHTTLAGLYVHPTKCTHPETTQFQFVQPPDIRSTLGLAWTCLFTLYVCTYQVLHLNVPSPREKSRIPGHQMLLTFAWSLVVIIAPEFILVDSLRDLWEARRCLKELRRQDNALDLGESQQHLVPPGPPRSNINNAHRRNVSPGSSDYRARAPSSEDDRHQHKSKQSPLVQEPWTLTHMLYANMGGFVVKDMSEEQDTRYLTVTGKLVPLAIERKLIAPEPPVSKAEIRDKSKDNNYTKLLAVMQIAYFGVEFFVRFALPLPITQLELAVASVAGYAVITYFCLWLKPKAVETPTLIAPWNNSLRRMEQQLRELSCSTNDLNLQADIDAALISHSAQDESFHRQASQKIASLGNFFKSGTEKEKTIWVVVFIVTSAPIGIMHLLAWNWYFPTDIDLWIWRIASITATGAGPVLLPIYLLLRRIGGKSADVGRPPSLEHELGSRTTQAIRSSGAHC